MSNTENKSVPQPKAAKFWNRISKKYARDPVADQASYEYKLSRTAQRLTPESRVLEFACGTGTTALYHAPNVAQIDAVDFSSAMIEIAREKAKGVDNVEFSVSSVEDWPETRAGYDLVMAHSFLHLAEDLDQVLAKIRACTKDGGLFVSSTVCLSEMSGLMARIVPKLGWTGLLPLVRAFTQKQLVAAIEASGFEIEEEWTPPKRGSVFIIARAV